MKILGVVMIVIILTLVSLGGCHPCRPCSECLKTPILKIAGLARATHKATNHIHPLIGCLDKSEKVCQKYVYRNTTVLYYDYFCQYLAHCPATIMIFTVSIQEGRENRDFVLAPTALLHSQF